MVFGPRAAGANFAARAGSPALARPGRLRYPAAVLRDLFRKAQEAAERHLPESVRETGRKLAEQVQGRGVDLQLSGHTHGGQMWPLNYVVPLQQPVLDGLERVGDVPVLTSRGVGAWGPAIRVLAPPEVPIVTLRRS